MLRRRLKDIHGGVDDALGLAMEVFVFTVIFVFGGVFIGSAGAQALSAIVAHHLAAVEASTTATFANAEAKSESSIYLLASSTGIVTSQSQCSPNTNACVVFEPCSAAQPVCTVVVERRVVIPVANMPIVWSAKAVSIWQQGGRTS
ncbi:hypothetical protein [Ferrimicrobium sp.]|uniref:hypothetical protein n=1 Tax=Ferrimicrobium sp. TaxID=2926050 RepID=UPI002637EAE2|nr:hypothetical protein [Ferrimicrobium sp.]